MWQANEILAMPPGAIFVQRNVGDQALAYGHEPDGLPGICSEETQGNNEV